ncbi:MAG: T9SS type A sorting domain-containing protein [Bacteroidota bacterium]
MKTLSQMKRALYTLALMIFLNNSAWGQIVYTQGFENSCSNYINSFAIGCIPNWISTSGTPDTQSSLGTAPEGSRYAHCYAKWDGGCIHPSQSEGIALNYTFQAGTKYKITYLMKVNPGLNSGSQSLAVNWILTNGLTNQSGGICTAGDNPPNIPAGSHTLATPSYNWTSWTSNQHIFTPTSTFNQVWLRNVVTSTVLNSLASSTILVDDFKIEIICDNPAPAIASPNSFCLGSPLSFTGSVANCSSTITNNVWTVVECTSTGGAVAGAVEWWSPWATGVPGTLTLPSAANGGPTIACGKYYRIKLAVQNPYTSWAETSKIIYINCPPSFKLKGSTAKICTGDLASLSASMNPGSNSTYTLNWTPISPAGPSIYNGPMAGVTVSPTVTTTYQATVTDNATGCTSTMQWTVNVVNNDPTFSLYVNTIPSSYFTVELTPNDPNGYNNPGFGFLFVIEELDGAGNPYYQNSGTSCWWTSYPNTVNPETFVGYVSTGTGTYSQNPSCASPAGQFLYNHTYRITRGVWNDECDYRQFATIITPVKSGGIEVAEDPNAPDYSALSLANAANHQTVENAISIYPNPSTGLYTIELADYTDASIEIYNVLGKKVKTIQQTTAKTTVDLTGFTKGVYFVNILSNGETISKKIILE